MFSFLLLGVASGQQLTVEPPTTSIDVRLARTSEQDYVLSAGNPMTFSVSGATYLRVYTRLRWQDGMSIPSQYILTLSGPNGVQFETLEAMRSGAAHGPNGENYAKWRSFYVRAPTSKVSYRLALQSSPSDTVAVRFAFETPPPWQEIAPAGAVPVYRIQDDSIVADWYRVSRDSALNVSVTGPVKFMVEARLMFNQGAFDKKDFALTVNDGEVQLQTQKFTVLRKKLSKCISNPALAPSIVRRLSIELPAGEHDLTIQFQVSGAEARYASHGAMQFFTKK